MRFDIVGHDNGLVHTVTTLHTQALRSASREGVGKVKREEA